MLGMYAESPPSAAPTHEDGPSFFPHETGGSVGFISQDTQNWQAIKSQKVLVTNRESVAPWCTLVAGHDDLSTYYLL